jgi:hypothetical protein
MTKSPARRFAWLPLCLLLATFGCDRARASSDADRTGTVSAKQTAAKVVRIVFVGKEHPCDCTRKTIDAGWAALEQALGSPPKLPVERIQIDTQPDKVEPYRSQKPVMALPGIYFVDGKNTVLELLQGNVTIDEIARVLAR